LQDSSISRRERSTVHGPPHHRALSLIRAYRHCNLGLLLLNRTASKRAQNPRSHLTCASQAKLLRRLKFKLCACAAGSLPSSVQSGHGFPPSCSFPSALQDSRACLLGDRVSPVTGPEPLIECEWRGCDCDCEALLHTTTRWNRNPIFTAVASKGYFQLACKLCSFRRLFEAFSQNSRSACSILIRQELDSVSGNCCGETI
jgi:hypothetical protein